MLNELYQMSCTLEKQGMLRGMLHHRDVHKPSKEKRMCIEINEGGMPCGMRLLGPESASRFWVHSHGNHDRFPAITIRQPLLARKESEKIGADEWKQADLAQKRAMLRKLDFSNCNPQSNEIQVRPWTLEQMAPVFESGDPDLEALRQLLQRFPKKDNVEFYQKLRDLVFQNIERADDKQIEFLRNLLIGEYKESRGAFVADCATYFEIAEIFQVDCLVASEETERALIACLCRAQEGESTQEDGISALSGKPAALVKDKYPNPDCKVIGPTYLFSNNSKASACLVRYGMGGTDTFPASAEQADKMCAALSFLMTDEREGKTWRRFPGTDAKKPRLLLAWLEDDPDCNIELAQALGSDEAAHTYETYCNLVLEQLDVTNRMKPGTPVHLKLFETLDKGRKQIALSASFTAEQLRADLCQWLSGAGNLPDISFRVRRKDRISTFRPFCPSPGAVYHLMRIYYRYGHGGEAGEISDRKKLPAPSLQNVYQLFLPHCMSLSGFEAGRFYRQCLERLLSVAGTLISHAGYFQVALPEQPFTEHEMGTVCSAISLMGIILYQLDDRKENYMKSQAFLVGRFLKLADYLHKCYCIVVRNDGDGRKSLPRQLMGNALLQIALQNPQDAMNLLGEKIRIYVGWADTYAIDNQSKGAKWGGYARWALRQLGKTASALAKFDDELPTSLNVQQKFELLLGYLAELPEIQSGQENEESGAEKIKEG